MASTSVVALKVTGLKDDVDEAALRAAFAPYGHVTSVDLQSSSQGEGYEKSAIVKYTTRTALEAANDAMTSMSKVSPIALASSSDGAFAVSFAEQPPPAAPLLTSQVEQQHAAPAAPAAPVAPAAPAAPAQPPHMQQPPPHMQPPPPHMQPPPQAPHMQPPPQPSPQQPYGGYGGYGSAQPYDQAQAYGQYPPGWPPVHQPPPGGHYGGHYATMPGGFGGYGHGPPPPAGGNGGARAHQAGSEQALTGEEVKLFVGGLPPDAGEMELRALMGPYGNIVDVHLMKPSMHSNQRCCFVTFEHHVSALAATKLGGVHKMNAVDRPIVVRFADSQAKRQRTAF